MKRLVKNIRKAITSRIRHKKEITKEQQKKLDICNKCVFNSKNTLEEDFTCRQKFLININKQLDYAFGVRDNDPAICLDCGCNLIIKTKDSSEEKCPKEKW